jgi:hypothetical protein
MEQQAQGNKQPAAGKGQGMDQQLHQAPNSKQGSIILFGSK